MIKFLVIIAGPLLIISAAAAQHPSTETTVTPQSAPAAGSDDTSKIQRKMDADRNPGTGGAASNQQPGTTPGAVVRRPDSLDPNAMHDERTPPAREGSSTPSNREPSDQAPSDPIW